VASARILIEPSIGDAVDRVEETESTPPVWYLLGWVAHRAGLSVEAVRFLSVLAGALTAALVVVYGQRLLPLWAAGTAGLLVALGGPLVARGHELRAYALYALLAVVFALALATAASRPTRWRLLGLAACVAAGLLTHYFFAFLVLAGLLWARSVRVTAATAAGVVPCLLWLPALLGQYENQRFSWIGNFDLVKAVSAYSAFFWNPGPLYVRTEDVELGAGETVARLAVLALVLVGAAVLVRHSPPASLTAALAVLPVAFAAVLWLAGANVFTARNLLCAAPFAAVAIAAVPVALPRRAALGAGTALIALAAGGLAREYTLAPPAYDRMAEELVREGWKLGDAVAVYGGAHEHLQLGSAYALRSPVAWYLPGRPFLRLPEGEGGACERAWALGLDERVPGQPDVDDIVITEIDCASDLPERVRADGGVFFVSAPR
jgi:Dolichyl-phosphate-mannose-protein mannosyltransferase